MADHNLAEVPTDELVRLARSTAEQRRKQETEAEVLARRLGEYISELAKRPSWTYVKIGQLLDLDDSTAHRIAKRASE